MSSYWLLCGNLLPNLLVSLPSCLGGLLPGEGGFWAGLDYTALCAETRRRFGGRQKHINIGSTGGVALNSIDVSPSPYITHPPV